MKYRLTIFSIITIVILLCVAGYFYKKHSVTSNNSNVVSHQDSAESDREYTTAQGLVFEGKDKEAVDHLRSSLALSSNLIEENRAKLALGLSLIRLKDDALVHEGLTVLTGLILDIKVDPNAASSACNGIAFSLSYLSSAQVAAMHDQLIAIDPTVDSKSKDSIYEKLLEKSVAIKKNSYALYLLAGSNAYSKSLASTSTPVVQKQATATKIQALIKEGDTIIDEGYSSERQAVGYYYRARALSASNVVLKNLSTTQIEEAFKKSIDFGKGSPAESKTFVTYYAYLSRFWYTGYLIDAFGEKRKGDVVAVIKPIADIKAEDTSFLASHTRQYFSSAYTKNPATKSVALKVAKISPAFKAFLQSAGFTSF